MALFGLFTSKKQKTLSYLDFWDWFAGREKQFHRIVRQGTRIEQDFFNKLEPKLSAVHEGIYYLAGMDDDDTAELILTAEGTAKNIVFVEELIAAAPAISGWKFTAHKPSLRIEDVHIEMDGLEFQSDNLYFYPDPDNDYPDEIAIVIVYEQLTSDNDSSVTRGVYVYLDNYLGDLNALEQIDRLRIVAVPENGMELIPISKLKEYLHWRQKEFLEKYEGSWHDDSADEFALLKGTRGENSPLLAVVNKSVLGWDRKASHPWMLKIMISYKGRKDGMPQTKTADDLEALQDIITQQLNDTHQCLYIGRDTAKHTRTIYFACKDYRQPSKIVLQVIKERAEQMKMEYEIFKDKYWQSLQHYIVS